LSEFQRFCLWGINGGAATLLAYNALVLWVLVPMHRSKRGGSSWDSRNLDFREVSMKRYAKIALVLGLALPVLGNGLIYCVSWFG
jgi:hypothetical protein